MNRRELIEDSEEVRDVIAELKAKTSANNGTDESYGDSYEDYTHEEDYVGEEYPEEEVYEEEPIAEPTPVETVGDAINQRNEARRARIKQYAKEAPSERSREHGRTKKHRKSKKDENVIISLKNVSMSYGKGKKALSNVNIDIRKGEFVFIVGESGSGKSTLIKLILRELKPIEGTINVNGYQVEKLKNRQVHKLRRCMGVVFQDFRLLKDRSVYENVAFAQRIVQASKREMKKNVPSMLAQVGLASKYRAKPGELSGGEQQRVALARALVNKPPILVADEPTGNLDPGNTHEIMSLLEQINEKGTTVIVVTHDMNIVNKMQKRVITIKKGIVLSDEEKGGYINED